VISGAADDELSEPLAADAYCRKGEFLSHQLLQAVSDLTRKFSRPANPPQVQNNPVQARWTSDRNYVVTCEDCLREFRVPRSPCAWHDEARAECVHCGKVVPFLITDRDPHDTPQL
jgi:hypothetical protein